jgi:hypothetical protein
MPFTNEVIGTNGVLIRNWLQSNNYVPGVSGWQITKAGAAEFNNGTFRGSIEVGSLTGQHFIVNNPSTGDVIDIYDSSNRLDFYISSIGKLVSQNAGSSPGLSLAIQGPTLSWDDSSVVLAAGPSIGIDSGNSGTQRSGLFMNSGVPYPLSSQLQLDLISDSGGHLYAMANQRGVFGSLIQNDGGAFNNGVNTLFHAGSYVGTTSDAFGDAVIAHGCSFTPKFCVFSTWDYASTAPIWWVTLWGNGMDATNFRVYIRGGNGNPPPSGTSFGLQAFFIG